MSPTTSWPTPSAPGGPIALAYCWSHVRRCFYDIAKGGNAPIASEALVRIGGALRHRRGDPRPQRRRAPRRAAGADEGTRRGVGSLAQGPTRAGLRKVAPSPKRSAMASTIGTACAASSTTAASRSIPIPSSARIRPIALDRGRMRSLPAATKAATTGPCVASLIETCKLNTVNPHAWTHRHTDKARQRLARIPDRRPDALGLRQDPGLTRQRVGGAPLTIMTHNSSQQPSPIAGSMLA